MFNKIRFFLTHAFFPHESNNYRAKLLQTISIVFIILVFIAYQSAVYLIKVYNPDILGYATNITVEKILDLVNQERIKNNLSPLTISSELTTAATQKAADMFTKDYWAHISPTGVTPWQFISSSGYDYIYAGENLAKNFDKSEDVFLAWMKSPTHRANILKAEYTDIGISIMNGDLNGEETTLVVQEFGKKSNTNGIVSNLVIPSRPPVHEIASSVNQEKSHHSPGFTTSVLNIINKFTSFSFTKNASLIVVEILLIILFIDSIYIWKNRLLRINGHSLAHIIFIIALFAAIGATGIGVIL
ncbi:hypothetical protein A2Y99_03690 [Candidatus Gottesmanbacteria bacterium RBG_13_37_7]|uniref:SCP domain-containing protein n=1 Tax=Candidatus Gottesmanbacteria bacterium RBG_13_37_7 TaxID=1798369 RepID=A0A1F5YKA4_9BACT|nr:MAG: hypothetical protein A2Y99_03690 [Candidatus Gottesmanbacteria bacterium RBG_13_37_7]